MTFKFSWYSRWLIAPFNGLCNLGRRQRVDDVFINALFHDNRCDARASTLRIPRLVPDSSGSNYINRLGGDVGNKSGYRSGLSEAAAHFHSYLGLVAIGDIDAIHHRDSTRCRMPREVSSLTFQLHIDGLVVELLPFFYKKHTRVDPGLSYTMYDVPK